MSQEGTRLTNLIEDRRRQISKMSDKKTERLRILREYDRASADAYDWLQRNLDRFEKPVYGPIVVELEVKDPRYINYVATTMGKSQGRVSSLLLYYTILITHIP
jgi:chromosome segregation ATPase